MDPVIGLLLVQTVLNVPAYSPPGGLGPVRDPTSLSLVVATTVSELDPQPLCDRPNCTSLFLARYKDARLMAGRAIEPEFSARVEMGSPWNRPYRLAIIVEQREGDEPLVRAIEGFNAQTGQACFDPEVIEALNWRPAGPGVSSVDGRICVTE